MERDRKRCEACGNRTMQLVGAERLADAVEAAVRLGPARGGVDARSPMGDALLDYRAPEDSDPVAVELATQRVIAAHGTLPRGSDQDGLMLVVGWRDYRIAGGVPHLTGADMGVPMPDPPLTISEMEHVIYAAKMELAKVLRRRARGAKR